MDYESIKQGLSDKNVLQIVWIFTLTTFMAIVRVFYKEVKTIYGVVRSGILSIGAGMLAGIVCYHYEIPFLMTLFITSSVSVTGEKFFDAIFAVSNEFPKIFKELLLTYLGKK